MSIVLTVVKDPEMRKILKHAEKQGFVISASGHGVSVRTAPTERSPRGVFVTTVSSTPGDWRSIRNNLAALKRGGYDENWMPSKKDSSAWKADIPAEEFYNGPIEPEVRVEPWQSGPFFVRALTFLEMHPNAWWSADSLAEIIGWNAASLKANGTNLARRDPHIIRNRQRFMWDQEGFGRYRTLLERRADAARATMAAPHIKWEERCDHLGRMVGLDDEGNMWYAVPRGLYDE